MLNSRFPPQKQFRRYRFAPCRSAFDGMSVYQYAAMKDNVYTAGKSTRTGDFEYLSGAYSLYFAAVAVG